MRITITGPRSGGKSTVARLLAKELKLKYYSSDAIGEKAMKKHGGLDKAIKSGIIGKCIKRSGYGLIREVYKKNNFVFDLSGGSISSRKYSEASEKVRKTAKKKSIIVGLLPFRQINKSVNLLINREKKRKHFRRIEHKEVVLQTMRDYKKYPPILKKLCNFIIYAENKKPKEIADEIMKRLGNENI